MLNRLILIASLIGLLGLSCYGWLTSYREKAVLAADIGRLVEALDQAREREASNAALLVARQSAIVSQARKLAQAQQALSEALQRNSDWSNTNVPPDVQNALGGLPSGPAGVLDN